MTEENGSLIASSALYVDVVRVRSRDQSLEFVLLLFGLEGGVKQVSVHWFKNIEIFYKPSLCYHIRQQEIL